MSNITRLALACGLAFCCTIFSTQHTQAQNGALAAVNNPNTKTTTLALTQTARYPGCEYDAYTEAEKKQCSVEMMKAYIQENLVYPEMAKQQDFKPRMVRVHVTVEPDGRVHSPRVMEPGERAYDAQAQMVFVKMTQENIAWVPGKFEDKAVASPYVATVHFNWEGRNRAFPELAYGDDIFEYVDEPPAFLSCQVPGSKDREVRACVQERMSDFFEQHMNYPADALAVGLEGQVEVEFVVGKNGQLQNISLRNDIGLGCGEEALRLVQKMNENGGLSWVPGEEDGQAVNVVERTTVKFRIPAGQRSKSKLKFIDARKVFLTERAGFESFLDTKLDFPRGEDINPCAQGVIDVTFQVAPVTEEIILVDMVDYNNLGKEFKQSVMDFLQETTGEWNTTYPNLSTETVYRLSVPFFSAAPSCPKSTDTYQDAVFQALDAAEMLKVKATQNDGLAILDGAVRNYPADNKLRHLRGMALYAANRRVEACVDLSFVSKQNKDIPVPKTCK